MEKKSRTYTAILVKKNVCVHRKVWKGIQQNDDRIANDFYFLLYGSALPEILL